MTQYPNYAQGGYNAPPPNPRPTSVTVLTILGMIWGALLIVCNLFSMIPLLAQFGPPNPVMDAMRADTVLHNWNIVATVARLGLGFALLIGSIGALMLKPWGRALMVGYALVAIVIAVIDTFMTVTHVLPILSRLAPTDPALQPIVAGQRIGLVVGLLLGVLFPLIILIFMTRPHVKAAFAGVRPAGAGGYPQPGYAQGGYPPTGYAPGAYPPGGQAPPPPAPPNGPYST